MPDTPLTYKVNELEKRLDSQAEEIKILRTRSHELSNSVQVILAKFDYMEKGLAELKEGQKASGRLMWTIAISLITATITIAIAIVSGTFG